MSCEWIKSILQVLSFFFPLGSHHYSACLSKHLCKMPQAGNQHGRDQRSIKYKWDPVEGAIFELTELVQEECASNLTVDHKNVSCEISRPKSSKLLTTPELISAVGHVLDYTSRSLSYFQQKNNFKNKVSCCQKEDQIDNLEWEKGCSISSLAKNKSLHPSTAYKFSSMVQPNLDCLRVIYGVSVIKTGNESYSQSSLQRFLGRGASMPLQTWEWKGLSGLGISYGLGNIYGWMSELVPTGVICLANNTVAESQKAGNYFSGITDSHYGDSGEHSPENFVGRESDDSCPGLVQSRDLASAANAESEISRVDIGSLHSDYYLENVKSFEADTDASTTCSSRLHQDYHVNTLAFRGKAYDRGSWSNGNNEVFESREEKYDNLVAGETSKIKICLLEHAKAKKALAKQEHAFAGAFAGIFVSLCLHPVDTIKTVVQSCHAEEKSLCYIGRSIVSERGIL